MNLKAVIHEYSERERTKGQLRRCQGLSWLNQIKIPAVIIWKMKERNQSLLASSQAMQVELIVAI